MSRRRGVQRLSTFDLRPRRGSVAWRPVARLGAVEAFYITALVVVGLFITWLSGYVVYKLYRGQS